MQKILKKILEAKKLEVRTSKSRVSLTVLKKLIGAKTIKTRDFRKSISFRNKLACIGELKIASPSKGYLHKNLDLVKTARIYEKKGIKAISVLTDKHFKGKLSDLKLVKDAVKLPVLRKDFIIDCYQVYESCFYGADAILLIAAILSKKKLSDLLLLTHNLGMEAIIEIHNFADLKKVDLNNARIIGINNRNLSDFRVDLGTTAKLRDKIPSKKTLISESGIHSRADILYLRKLKVNAVLIGEGIVTAYNIPVKIKELLGKK